MSRQKRYPIAKAMRQMTMLLNVDAGRVLRRAGLAPDFLDNEGRGVVAREYFALWQAAFDEVGDPNLALEMGQQYAGSPFLPAVLAFSSSPNTEIGLDRLALFKPLVGPVKLDVVRADETLQIKIGSSEAEAPMPATASAFELVYFVECIRKFTGEHVVPLAVCLPDGTGPLSPFDDYFGVAVTLSSDPMISLSLEDAHRPLISENAEFWEWLEVDLRRQLAERDTPVSMIDRVRAVLVDMLPSGEASADAICNRLGMSKRSLQRRLQAEGESFQSVLDATRSELSIRYLAKGSMSVEEISYLLAYRDPNSFYRAFHGWTGMTPAEARGQTVQ